MKRIYLVFALILMLVISGCANYTAQSLQSWSKHQQQLRQLIHWQAVGVVGIQTPKQAETVYVRWQQAPHQYTLWFSGSLGANNGRLQGTSGELTLLMPDGKIYHAATPEELIKQQLGWSLPMTPLKDWIVGLPSKGEKRLLLSSNNRPKDLYQNGWHIHYENYQPVNDIALPGRLTLTRDDLTIKIIIKSWKASVDKRR